MYVSLVKDEQLEELFKGGILTYKVLDKERKNDQDNELKTKEVVLREMISKPYLL